LIYRKYCTIAKKTQAGSHENREKFYRKIDIYFFLTIGKEAFFIIQKHSGGSKT
tara:strand:- start:121 stop:282 length:162 start_codon:yes stop_codon:yes gene_type:complete